MKEYRIISTVHGREFFNDMGSLSMEEIREIYAHTKRLSAHTNVRLESRDVTAWISIMEE